MGEPSIDFGTLLQNLNIKNFSLYLIGAGILHPSEIEALQDLKTDSELIVRLNQILGSSSKRRQLDLLGTVKKFSRHTYDVVSLTLNGSTAFMRQSKYHSDSSSSSDDFDDFTAGQYSQECPDQDEFFDRSQDTGYSSLASSLSDHGPHRPPSQKHLSVCRPTGSHHRSSRKTERHRKPRVVNNYIAHNYFGTDPAAAGYIGYSPYSQLQPGLSPGAVQPAIGMPQSTYGESAKQCLSKLQACTKELIECMDVPTLLPYLQQEQLVTLHEVEALSNVYKTRREKNQYLLSILPSKGEDAFDRFIRCLLNANEHSGHAHLAKLLI